MAAPPRSTAGRSLKAPPNLPIGVRAPATITDRAVTGPCYLRSAGPEADVPLVRGHVDGAAGVCAEVCAPCACQGTPGAAEVPDRVGIQVPGAGRDDRACVGRMRESDRDVALPAGVDIQRVAARRERAREEDVPCPRLHACRARHGDIVELDRTWPAIYGRAVAQQDMTERCPS